MCYCRHTILLHIKTDRSVLLESVPVGSDNIYYLRLNLGGVMADTTTFFKFNPYNSQGG